MKARKLVGNMSFTFRPRTWTVIYVKLHSVCWNRFFFFCVFLWKSCRMHLWGKYKKVSASVDSRLKAKKSVEDCHAKVGLFLLRVVRSGMLQKISIQWGGLCPPKTLGIHNNKHECSKWEIQNDYDFLFMLSISLTHGETQKTSKNHRIQCEASLYRYEISRWKQWSRSSKNSLSWQMPLIIPRLGAWERLGRTW